MHNAAPAKRILRVPPEVEGKSVGESIDFYSVFLHQACKLSPVESQVMGVERLK